MWDPAIWQKSDAEWERARTLQEQHMQRAAAGKDALRAAAEAEAAAAQPERDLQTACIQEREALARNDIRAAREAIYAQLTAARNARGAASTTHAAPLSTCFRTSSRVPGTMSALQKALLSTSPSLALHLNHESGRHTCAVMHVAFVMESPIPADI